MYRSQNFAFQLRQRHQCCSFTYYYFNRQGFSSNIKPNQLRVLTMPQLSPSMSVGRILKWHKNKLDAIASYDMVLHVGTKQLEKSNENEIKEKLQMLEIEVVEGDLVMVEQFQAVDTERDIEVDTPIALFIDEDSFSQYKNLEDLKFDIDPRKNSSMIKAQWQAYVTAEDETVNCK